MKRALAVLLVLASAHLLLLYLNFAFRYSATVGIEQATRESKTAGNITVLFLAFAVCLQFLIAWLLRPARMVAPTTDGASALELLPESHRLAIWERYGVLLALSVVGTLSVFGLIVFIAGRTNYLPALLKFLGLD
jgi:hypothetical protein